MLYLAIVSLFTTSESGSNPSDGFCILLRYFVHNVPDLCKEDLVVHIRSLVVPVCCANHSGIECVTKLSYSANCIVLTT